VPDDTAVRPTGGRAVIRTPDQRLRVFVSSTLGELAPERAAVREAIEQLRLVPVMFELGARPHPPRDLYRAYLEQSHVFVGIYWQKYGWVAPGESVSGLEDEYRLSGGHPRLLYVKRTESREPRLEELLGRIRADDTASYRPFSDPDELRGLLLDDLAILLTERFEQVMAPARLHSDRRRTNLPVPRTSLVGREGELAAACDLLRDGKGGLVTLTGPGGGGKSRLALQAALEAATDFEDGACLVMLESIRDPDLVVPAIAAAMRVHEAPERPSLDVLAEHIGDARLLLVLDNFEHVIAAAPAVSALLERCPRLAVLATSRTPLRVRGEHQMAIPPLPVPDGRETDPDRLARCPAVALFVQRAAAVRPGFQVTAQNARVVAEICRRLDGLPLALELAASRLRVLEPEALLERLARRLDILKGGGRDLPERQQTLRKTIDWSHGLLDEDARKVFRRLSAFAGGSTLEAAEALCDLDGDLDEPALDVVGSLVDGSMVTAWVGEEGALRIGMLETMREYAAERLVDSGEQEEVRARHAGLFTSLGEQAGPGLSGPEEAAWVRRLQAERDNLRAALEWCSGLDPGMGLRLCAAIWRFWEGHDGIGEGHHWLERLLARPTPDPEMRARALHGAAALACYVGAYPLARAHMEEALPLVRALGDDRARASTLNELGILAGYEGDFAEARRLLEEAIAVKRRLGLQGSTANSLTNLGLVHGYAGEHERAHQLHAEALAVYRGLGEQMGAAIATGNLAHAAMHLGRWADARAGLMESLGQFHTMGDADGAAECVERLAMLAEATGELSEAARFLGLADVLRHLAETVPPAHEREARDRVVETVRAALGETAFRAEWQAGSALAVADLLGGTSEGDPSAGEG
jgi:predicted ATPase